MFRDDTGLSVNPALWQSITNALDESEYFILLASPAAAQSEWVNQEIAYWMESRADAAEGMLPVVTAGTWTWDSARNDIDWAASTAAPPALATVFSSEPRHLELEWAHSEEDLDLRNTRFRGADSRRPHRRGRSGLPRPAPPATTTDHPPTTTRNHRRKPAAAGLS